MKIDVIPKNNDGWLKEVGQGTSAEREQHHLREQLQAKAQRLTDAVAEAGHSPTLLVNLRSIEAQIAEIDRRTTFSKPIEISAAVNQARQFAYTTVLRLKELFRGEATALKAVLAQHIGQLTLIP